MPRSTHPTAEGWEPTLCRSGPDGVRVPLEGAEHRPRRPVFRAAGQVRGRRVKGRSPTWFITVARFRSLGLSDVNTHFVTGAFQNCAECAGYRDIWPAHWDRLTKQVAREHKGGFDVVVTAEAARRGPSGWQGGVSVS